MKKICLIAFLAIFISLGAFADQLKAITIINNTEYQVKEIYCSPSIEEDWGENLLQAGSILEWGDKTIVYIDASKDCYFDFELVDTDGDYYRKTDIDVCKTDEIEFVFNDFVSDDGYYDDDDYYDDYDDYYDDYSYDYNQGYDEGYSYGYSQGFRDGYTEAFKEAYKAGFSAGIDTADELRQ